MTIHVFNPEHDLALADGHAGYSAPESARRFARDCALLPLWYAQADEGVYAPGYDKAWLERMCRRLPALRDVHVVERIGPHDRVEPWGWDAAVAHATEHGDPESIERIRRYAHRRHTTTAMQQLQERLDFPLPAPAEELGDLEQTLAFAERQGKWVFKAPLSGSGRGILMGHGQPSAVQTAWIRSTLRRQGSLMGEAQLDKVQDFAMEFLLTEKECRWSGWSLFGTHGGGAVYAGNLLASDPVLEARLGQLARPEQLESVRRELPDILRRLFPHYEGIVGVDMLLYRAQGSVQIHPMVEMNLRRTMGWVARQLSDRWLAEGSSGAFFIRRVETGEQERLLTKQTECVLENGRLVHGTLVLTPIVAGTGYAAWMEADQQEESAQRHPNL